MGTMTKDVSHLNSFLRGELAAVETYRMALEKLDAGSTAYTDVASCLRSHEQRVNLLRNAVTQCGGVPASGAGAWGVFAKAVEGSARLFGNDAAIAALEEGEDHGLADYRRDLKDLDAEARQLVETELLPAQIETHRAMSNLKHRPSG
jgi:hypothetical protein